MSVSASSFGSVRLFPAACFERHRPFLVRVEPGAEEAPRPICPRCGTLGRLIPGAYYTGRYVDTVETAIDILESAHLVPKLARDYMLRLEGLLPSPTHRELRLILSESNGIESLQELLPPTIGGARELRSFFGLLLALLSVYVCDGRSELVGPGL